ncbi:Rapamycin-insensitive companion of mTOR, N-term-domain-containing protein [Amanita rubescens]|nr:Rapamycin-insensitive companion of mTOR, N-term-domain-containing protein [Amanita rubescens]
MPTLVQPGQQASNGTGATSFTILNNQQLDVTGLEGKDPQGQLEDLQSQLARENRIREGAENLLNMQLADNLRLKVESELDLARSKIEAIAKRIDIESSRKKSKARNMTTNGVDKVNDDFRTARHNAFEHLKKLESLGRQVPPTQASSSSAAASQTALEVDRQLIDALNKLTDTLRRNLRVRYELSIPDIVKVVAPCLADPRSKQCRSSAYRLIRHALVDADSVKCIDQSLDWYIVKSLCRDNKHAIEKEQAIKLIRTMVEIGSTRPESLAANGIGIVPLSEPVMRSLIAISEHLEDPFRSICIQTLAEILLVDIDLVARTGGLRYLLHILGDGPVELSLMLASVFLHIADSPRTRAYLHVGTDLELALSPITDAYGKGAEHVGKMRGCAKVVQMMLRTWSGLIYYCMDNMRAIRSVIDTLRIPSLETREIILDLFFELLSIKTSDWYHTFISGRRLTMYRKAPEDRLNHPQHGPVVDRPQQNVKLTDQYMALLVVILTKAGLCEALTSMLEETKTGSNLSRKATLLLAEFLQTANKVLPLVAAAEIQAIPEVFSMATSYGDAEHRIVGSSAMSAIDSLNRNKTRLEPASPFKSLRPRANSVEDAVRRGQRQVEQAKLKMSLQMDDATFRSAILETQVMITKDFTKWNYDTLLEIVEGPLLNHKRLEEAIRVSRFIRRLASFFHPFSHRFSDIVRTPMTTKWIRLGCSLLNTLMKSPEGIKYLSTEDQFLSQIVKAFAQLDPFNGVPDSDPIFSRKRVSETLTYGYLEMLGTLSKYQEGIELLEMFKVFTVFYHLSELRSREDLIKGIIENLDYTNDGHPRIVLSKALTSSYKHIRLYATRHLGTLIRNSASANAWTLRLLLTQLYDPASEVCEMAVHFLEEACEDKEVLQMVVEMQPTMDHLGEIGHPLLLKFMSTPMGFRYLYDAGYIDREMDVWFNERNIYYVVHVEVFLSKSFQGGILADEDEDMMSFEGIVPPHFYGEMSKTELGCQVLQEKGHFSDFSQFIRQHGHEDMDAEIIMKLKSTLWAVGNVGATEGGLRFLEEEDMIPVILDIAENSPIPSLKGTCFFVLGLISSTVQGADILAEYGWEAALSPLGMPTGICTPASLEKFINIPSWTENSSEINRTWLKPVTVPMEKEVITAVQNLANSVIANAASRTLTKLKSRPEYRPVFTSPVVFFRAMHIISTQRFRLPVRRYVIDLFGVEMNSELVSTFMDCAKTLKASPTQKATKLQVSQSDMFANLGRSGHDSGSESEGDDSDPAAQNTTTNGQQPVLAPKPVHKVVGFDA